MTIFSEFTESQTAAWDWIRASVDEGITATQALQQYRSAGNAIRTQDWYRVFNSVRDYGDIWQDAKTFAANETIPERLWMNAPRNFAQDYVAEVEVAIRNNETGELTKTFRYIENDYRMSQDEIKGYLEQMGNDYPTGETWNIDYIYGMKFYKKGK